MSNFGERFELAAAIENRIEKLFSNDIVQEFGCTKIVDSGTELFEFLSTPEINRMPSGMIIKFAPDFIILTKTKPQKIYFLEVKHSISPIYTKSRLNLMKKQAFDNTLKISDVGVVAREALLSYRRYYPNTILLMASPYNPKKLMAQFAENVKCLYCYRSNKPDYDCNNCPAMNNRFFDIERANNSTGSQTPMTNVDLRSFDNAKNFFAKLGIKINESILDEIEKLIINEPVCFDNKVLNNRKNEVIQSLINDGCYWLEKQVSPKVYSTKDNSFIHFDRNCFCIKNSEPNIITYDNIEQAKKISKKSICKFCGKFHSNY